MAVEKLFESKCGCGVTDVAMADLKDVKFCEDCHSVPLVRAKLDKRVWEK